ncbi:MAG: DNA topoisomerase VI subunit B [Thermoprotei archaeon]|nr:MAG: DNA topoisomerase VI subunit B [Thermoprotei archaeon]RLE98843.1 MAG: DNA topoisomerase VI subunit B [Thermoprotei archaeon]
MLLREYKGLSPAEFFYRNKEIAGFSNPTRAVYQTIRELVENALDATELYRILPDIKILVNLRNNNGAEFVEITVEDNGIGIPRHEVPNVFGRVFYGSKYKLRQSRGVFGLGVKMAVLYAQITTGKPIYVRSSTPYSCSIYEYEILIDITANRPIVLNHRIYKKRRRWHGTVVKLTIQGNWSSAKRRVEEYIKRTAMITPYANIYFKAPDLEISFKRVTRKLPSLPIESKPHPHGVDLEMLKAMISPLEENLTLREFLITRFDSIGETTADNFCKWAGFSPSIKVKKLDLKDLTLLMSKMKEYNRWRRPRGRALSPLGTELLKKGIEETLHPEFTTAVTRKPSSYSGNPFIVEVALAWGGKIPTSDKPILYRFANKIPLLYDEGADVSRKIVDSIDWSYYKVKFPAPLAIVIHICSTKLPFKGVGKEAIADVVEIEREIENAIKEAARRLRAHLVRIEKIYELKKKKITFEKYIPEVSRALSEICRVKEEYIREKLLTIMNRILEKRGSKEVMIYAQDPGAKR